MAKKAKKQKPVSAEYAHSEADAPTTEYERELADLKRQTADAAIRMTEAKAAYKVATKIFDELVERTGEFENRTPEPSLLDGIDGEID